VKGFHSAEVVSTSMRNHAVTLSLVYAVMSGVEHDQVLPLRVAGALRSGGFVEEAPENDVQAQR
jgi:hypothetical protein